MSEMKNGDIVFVHSFKLTGLFAREAKETGIVVSIRPGDSFTVKLVKPRWDGAEFLALPWGEKGRMWS